MTTVWLCVFVFVMNVVVMLVALSRRDTPMIFVSIAVVVVTFMALVRALRNVALGDLPPERR